MLTQFKQVLTLLCDGDVDFIVVGGIAMTSHGSAYITYDLDICYSRSPASIRNLCLVLAPIRPRLRGAPDDLPFRFDEKTVASGLNFTLATDLGDLDLLGELKGIGMYDDVLPYSVKTEAYGIPCRVLSVTGLIQSKRAAGRKKDLDAIPELEALLDLQEKLGELP